MTQTAPAVVSLFEMCNPDLLSTQILSEMIKTRLCLPVFSMSRESLGRNYLIVFFYIFFKIQILSGYLQIAFIAEDSKSVQRKQTWKTTEKTTKVAKTCSQKCSKYFQLLHYKCSKKTNFPDFFQQQSQRWGRIWRQASQDYLALNGLLICSIFCSCWIYCWSWYCFRTA